MAEIRMVRPGDRVEGQPTPGIRRETAVEADGLWAGWATTEPGMTSAWHHHGEHRSVIYVLTGRLRMEFGPGGTEVLDAAPGDFIDIDPGAVHRESNPSAERADVIVVRAGSGAVVVNVAGPESA